MATARRVTFGNGLPLRRLLCFVCTMSRDLVTVYVCQSLPQAGALRTALQAEGIVAVVAGENHAAAMGGLLNSMIALELKVPGRDAERARALIHALDSDQGVSEEELTAAALAAGVDPDDDIDPRGRRASVNASHVVGLPARLALRRQSAIALFVGTVVPFGSGHAIAGKWLRAMALAGLSALAMRYVFAGAIKTGMTLLGVSYLLDAVGAQLALRANAVAAAQLPQARVQPSLRAS